MPGLRILARNFRGSLPVEVVNEGDDGVPFALKRLSIFLEALNLLLLVLQPVLIR